MAYNTIFTRKTILAALLAIGVAGSAQAQVVGGGGATFTGGGDDSIITYNAGGAGDGTRYEQLGRTVTFGNSDGSPSWTYGPAPASAPGREAWMIGGGDDRQVVYVSPYQRR